LTKNIPKKNNNMGPEQLYFIIGFLLGVMLMGSISVAFFLMYHEWTTPTKKDESLFD
jgi:hypothetical protein